MVEPQVIGVGESESGFRFGFKGQKTLFLIFRFLSEGIEK